LEREQINRGFAFLVRHRPGSLQITGGGLIGGVLTSSTG
jgi:hypothetical protein